VLWPNVLSPIDVSIDEHEARQLHAWAVIDSDGVRGGEV
jgi:hypothetical protein